MDVNLAITAACAVLLVGLTLASWGLGRWSTAYERGRLTEDVEAALAAQKEAERDASAQAHGARADLGDAADLVAADDLPGVLRQLDEEGTDAPPRKPGYEADA